MPARSEQGGEHLPLGHQPVIPPRIGASPERLEDVLLKRFRATVVPDVSDAVGRLYTMDSGIRPLYEPIKRVAGTALTVKAVPGDNWAILGALGLVQANDVLVVDWRGYREACGTGALSLIAPIEAGLAGVVIDGGWRDIPELQELDFPVFGRGISAFSPAKRELGEINVPVCCGGVVVEPGDVVVADVEGVAVVPRRHAEQVARHLPEHEPPKAFDAYPRRELARESRERARRFRDEFEAKGGLEPPRQR